MNDIRQQKIQSLIQEEIGSMIVQGKIKDPRISPLLSVSQVKVSGDLSYARVFVSSFNQGAKLGKAVDALNHAAGFVQKTLGKKLRVRTTPRLTFVADHSIMEGFEVNRKIDEAIKHDEESRSGSTE